MVEPKDPSLGASGPEGDARVGRPLLIAARFRRKAKGLLFSPEHAGALLLAPCNDENVSDLRGSRVRRRRGVLRLPASLRGGARPSERRDADDAVVAWNGALSDASSQGGSR